MTPILHCLGTGFGNLTSIWVARYKDHPKNIVIKKTYLDIPDSEKIDLMRVRLVNVLQRCEKILK